MFDPGVQKLVKKIVFATLKKKILAIPIILAKIIEDFEVHFSFKLILTVFLQHQSTHKSKNLYKIGNVR